jgi:hypothetical protein
MYSCLQFLVLSRTTPPISPSPWGYQRNPSQKKLRYIYECICNTYINIYAYVSCYVYIYYINTSKCIYLYVSIYNVLCILYVYIGASQHPSSRNRSWRRTKNTVRISIYIFSFFLDSTARKNINNNLYIKHNYLFYTIIV